MITALIIACFVLAIIYIIFEPDYISALAWLVLGSALSLTMCYT